MAQGSAAAVRSAAPSSPDALSLELRHRPVQRRGVERFTAILNAARALLSDAGLERFTMEDVAARAGVPVGSVYQFFPNKYALVAEISAQDTQEIVRALSVAAAGFPTEDWQSQTDRLFAHMARNWARDPWRAAVFAAMRSTAATRHRASEHAAILADAVTQPLTPLTPTLSKRRRTQVALVLVETCQPLLNLTVQEGRVNRSMLREVQRLARAYLRAVALGAD